MSQDNDIITQADALMRRHRSFVARVSDLTNEETAAAVASRTDIDIDIPVLTDVVDASADATASSSLDIDTVFEALREDIESELSEWLIEVLPAAVANASQNILTELDAKARHTLLPRLLEMLEARRRNADQGSDVPSV